MCSVCLEEYGGDKVEYPADDKGLRDLIGRLYETHVTGGPLHVHLEDMNLEDDMLDGFFSCARTVVGLRGCDEPEACDALAQSILDRLKTFDLPERSRIVWETTAGL